MKTELGKTAALQALAVRRASRPQKVDNSKLYAGSPMFYYCQACGHLADELPEAHFSAPRRLCGECQALRDLGWLE